MSYSTYSQFFLAFALVLAPGVVVRGDEDPDAAPPVPKPEADAGRGFPWLCFTTSIVVIGGMYVFVRRRERALEMERKERHELGYDWYCRACDRDVSGPECPRCHALNPFLRERTEADARPRRGSR